MSRSSSSSLFVVLLLNTSPSQVSSSSLKRASKAPVMSSISSSQLFLPSHTGSRVLLMDLLFKTGLSDHAFVTSLRIHTRTCGSQSLLFFASARRSRVARLTLILSLPVCFFSSMSARACVDSFCMFSLNHFFMAPFSVLLNLPASTSLKSSSRTSPFEATMAPCRPCRSPNLFCRTSTRELTWPAPSAGSLASPSMLRLSNQSGKDCSRPFSS
mmetsp:Transcript_38881/g.100506  ORF Transcript_38881/g.100506 Transcript_38881/m.100506 type:complete len:214 (+) Transcript_38881:1214-1855(+)